MDENKIISMYLDEKLSTYQISKAMSTYPNKIRRVLEKHIIERRSKSEAQSEALKSGIVDHPTKGKPRSEETKNKIGDSVGKAWDNLDPKEKERRRLLLQQIWEDRDDLDKIDMIKKGQRAMKDAAKTGSKIEKYLLSELSGAGFKVQFHKAQWLQNQKLEVDLFLPEIKTVIEVDGMTHQTALFGDKRLATQKKADQQKDGLVQNQGMIMIRIKLQKNISKRYMRNKTEELLEILNKIKQNFPPPNERFIVI